MGRKGVKVLDRRLGVSVLACPRRVDSFIDAKVGKKEGNDLGGPVRRGERRKVHRIMSQGLGSTLLSVSTHTANSARARFLAPEEEGRGVFVVFFSVNERWIGRLVGVGHVDVLDRGPLPRPERKGPRESPDEEKETRGQRVPCGRRSSVTVGPIGSESARPP